MKTAGPVGKNKSIQAPAPVTVERHFSILQHLRLQLFGQLGFIGSGFYDGVAPSVFDRFPAIQAVRKAVATHPAVLAWYDGRGDAVSGGEAYLRDCRDIE